MEAVATGMVGPDYALARHVELEMVHYQKFWVLVLLGSWPFGSAYWVLSIAIPNTFMDFKVRVLSPSPRYWVL